MTPAERIEAIRLLHDLNGDLVRTKLSLTATDKREEQEPLREYITETNVLIGRTKAVMEATI